MGLGEALTAALAAVCFLDLIFHGCSWATQWRGFVRPRRPSSYSW